MKAPIVREPVREAAHGLRLTVKDHSSHSVQISGLERAGRSANSRVALSASTLTRGRTATTQPGRKITRASRRYRRTNQPELSAEVPRMVLAASQNSVGHVRCFGLRLQSCETPDIHRTAGVERPLRLSQMLRATWAGRPTSARRRCRSIARGWTTATRIAGRHPGGPTARCPRSTRRARRVCGC